MRFGDLAVVVSMFLRASRSTKKTTRTSVLSALAVIGGTAEEFRGNGRGRQNAVQPNMLYNATPAISRWIKNAASSAIVPATATVLSTNASIISSFRTAYSMVSDTPTWA